MQDEGEIAAMSQPFRLSRLSTPRGTLVASLLLIVTFVTFGLLAEGIGTENREITRKQPWEHQHSIKSDPDSNSTARTAG